MPIIHNKVEKEANKNLEGLNRTELGGVYLLAKK